MTLHEAEVLGKLLDTKKREVKIDQDDSEILKAIVFNMAIREAKLLVTTFAKGEIDIDVIKSL